MHVMLQRIQNIVALGIIVVHRLASLMTNEYSTSFKKICNLAHTSPGDNQPPIYSCSGAESYNMTFCPS